MIVYHGTRSIERILDEGFQLTQQRDAGDFGAGIYTTTERLRAACYGRVLVCDVDVTGYAVVPNPYFIDDRGREVEPTTLDEWVFYELAFDDNDAAPWRCGRMRTVGPIANKMEAAALVRGGMMAAGYSGIVTQYRGECVTFDPNTVRVLWPYDEQQREEMRQVC